VWRYRYDGLFRSVVDFYSDVLARDRWTRRDTSPNGSVGFGKHYAGFFAEGVVSPERDGYSLWVTVDQGYESGCGR